MQPRGDTEYNSTSLSTAAMPIVFAVANVAAHERYAVIAGIPVAYLNADNSSLGTTTIL